MVLWEGCWGLLNPWTIIPLLLFHMGTLDTGRGDVVPIEHGYMAQGLRNKGIEAKGFLLDPPSGGVGLEKNCMDLEVSNWLHSCC